jgi:hypothetical protein
MPDIELMFFAVLIVVIFGGTKLSRVRRAAAMRALAARRGFSFREGAPSMFGFFSPDPNPIPYTFRPQTYPANKIDRTWNVIEGDAKGISILILDSNLNLGGRNQQVCTFIAARADMSPFKDRDSNEDTVLTNGWIALYRPPRFFCSSTLSIKRLERHLDNLVPTEMT